MGDMVFKPAINYAREIEIGLPVKFEDIDFHSEVEWLFFLALIWAALIFLIISIQHYQHIAEKFREFYFGQDQHQSNNHSKTFERLSNLISDSAFNYGIDRYAKIHGSKSTGQTYFYRYSQAQVHMHRLQMI